MKLTFPKYFILLLASLLFFSGCQLIDFPTLIAAANNNQPTLQAPTHPMRTYRDAISVGYSDYHREHGYVKVTLDFANDTFRTVSIKSFDSLGRPKNDYYDYEPHQTALGLSLRLRTLGPGRISQLEGVSGATTTVNAIKQAARRAEEKARFRQEESKSYYDGTFVGVSDRILRGWTIAVITIRNDRLEHLMFTGVGPATAYQADGTTQELLDDQQNFIYTAKGPDYPWRSYHQAITELEKRYVEVGWENLDVVDTVSRATVTSTEAKIALQRALEAAKR
ncbi:MAG: FMN-binding protein [Symbiobacteriaceae bacterium]|nr:FMN-binding protein [Symbiobacteriaceae bacterium]